MDRLQNLGLALLTVALLGPMFFSSAAIGRPAIGRPAAVVAQAPSDGVGRARLGVQLHESGKEGQLFPVLPLSWRPQSPLLTIDITPAQPCSLLLIGFDEKEQSLTSLPGTLTLLPPKRAVPRYPLRLSRQTRIFAVLLDPSSEAARNASSLLTAMQHAPTPAERKQQTRLLYAQLSRWEAQHSTLSHSGSAPVELGGVRAESAFVSSAPGGGVPPPETLNSTAIANDKMAKQQQHVKPHANVKQEPPATKTVGFTADKPFVFEYVYRAPTR